MVQDRRVAWADPPGLPSRESRQVRTGDNRTRSAQATLRRRARAEGGNPFGIVYKRGRASSRIRADEDSDGSTFATHPASSAEVMYSAPPALLVLDANSNYVPGDDDFVDNEDYGPALLPTVPDISGSEPDSEHSGSAGAPNAFDLPVPSIGGWNHTETVSILSILWRKTL